MKRRAALTLVAAAVLAGCDSAESRRIEDTRARLVGTWTDEVADGEATFRRELVLGADGRFTDRVVRTNGGNSQVHDYGGEWSYDGSNLKRRFLREDGRQFSGGAIHYATFTVKSVTATEFVVDDNIQRREARFRRVAQGTSSR